MMIERNVASTVAQGRYSEPCSEGGRWRSASELWTTCERFVHYLTFIQ